MEITVNIAEPLFDAVTKKTKIRLTSDHGGHGEIHADLNGLLPFTAMASPVALDLFHLSIAVYGIDRFIQRKPNSVDGWSRELSVVIPVSNRDLWDCVRDDLSALLSFQTGDYWQVSFSSTGFTYPVVPMPSEYDGDFSKVNLFSGGMDSLIGAIDHLAGADDGRLLLTSHYDSQMKGPKTDQLDLLEDLGRAYPDKFVHIPAVGISLKETNLFRETTFRSRSVLFIGIAVLAAETKQAPVIVPENGTVSLNFPLSASRRSSCSTRTTHPRVIIGLNTIFEKVGISARVLNPYAFDTKGEMVDKCLDKELLLRIVNRSNSCGKRGHRSHWTEGRRDASHCGICMPCAYRRAALTGHHDRTSYGNELNDLPPFQKQKAQDIAACLEFLREPLDRQQAKEELIINGVKDIDQLNTYADLVLRTREELKKWVSATGESAVLQKAGLA